MRNPGRPGTRGMTLIEVVISVTIFSIAVLMTFSFMVQSQGYYQEATLDLILQDQAQTMLDDIANDIVGGGILNPYMPYNTDQVEFQKVIAVQDQAAVFGPPIKYSVRLQHGELANDKDDNGDGVADELELVKTGPEFNDDGTPKEYVKGRGIAQNGLRFDMPTNKTLNIELITTARDQQGRIHWGIAQTTVRLRNQ